MWMLATHFSARSAFVESSLITFGCRAARSAAPYGDAFGVIFWPSDVDYAGLPSLIGRIEGTVRPGSMSSVDWCIVIGTSRPGRPSNRSVGGLFSVFLLAVSRGASAPTPRNPPESAGFSERVQWLPPRRTPQPRAARGPPPPSTPRGAPGA